MNPIKKISIQFAVLIASVILLLIITPLNRSINSAFENISTKVHGELIPDTNIVLIHITKDDLALIGPWPIKRSYYALLINRLKKEGVKKIGVEIFLSAKLATQTIYDNTLKNEISKAGNVVLSSIAGAIEEKNNLFATDSLSFPSPKLLDNRVKSGFINFLRDDGIIIPAKIDYADGYEKSFSSALLDSLSNNESIKINFISSWKSFRNYSFLEFMKKSLSGNTSGLNLKGKIVIIGISDPQIATAFNSYFEDGIPGIALHAFALDNLVNNRYLKQDYKIPSAIFFVLFSFLVLYLSGWKNKNKILIYSVSAVSVILISYFLYCSAFHQLSISFFILPFATLIFSELIFTSLDKTNLLKGIISEREVLQKLLEKKESELNTLKSELMTAKNDNTENLQLKISELENDITKLRKDEEDSQSVQPVPGKDTKTFQGIVYRSKEMEEVAGLISKAAPVNTTTLIIGESGTGKELVAKAIHNLSDRKDKPFVAVNCAAIPENLFESELFGHVRGSFTGAIADKKGKFEIADKGTIFLDEIGELSENFQVKLLRVLQSGEIEKVGSTEQHKVNVRVIAATNKNLESEVKEKKFREDLYYRINVFKIEIPTLRNRKGDIEILAEYFIHKENKKLNLSKAAMKVIMEYEWKGNVRELETVMKRAVIFAASENREIISVSDFPAEIVKTAKYNFDDLVIESLRNKKFSHSSVSETAKELGNLNRTMISENFRGTVFKFLKENDFDINKTVLTIAGTNDKQIIERVQSKIQKYISNIQNDIEKSSSKNFEDIKAQFHSKYKNLPVKFHFYQDELIKFLMKKESE